ncbi:hypothetical protein [Pseudenhygromyxa sp. WMMC2535]|uniref:hypothetical protein n=1 Tax=Pseudenhygromyxa sp. WMMC2535 TaxID=2712867 RepID=UPI001556A168|nr:hypothetical protein [Pseudenhygromyxa sp. WMMC2535]
MPLAACFDPNTSAAEGAETGSEDDVTAEGTQGEGDSSSSAGSSEESADTSESTVTGDPDECDASSICVDPVPDGWNGPVAHDVTPASQNPSCGEGYSMTAVTAASELDPGAFECGCSCEATGASCPTSGTLEIWDLDGCSGTPDHTVVLSEANACQSITGNLPTSLSDDGGSSKPLALDWFGMQPSAILGGTCQAEISADIGPAAFEVEYLICEPAGSLPACAISEGLCAPVPASPLEPGVCIWKAGVEECPAGSYSNKVEIYGGIEDSRSCEGCDCGDPVGECTATINLQELDDNDCVGLFTVSAEDCTPSDTADVELATFNPGEPEASCDGEGVAEQVGEVAASEPYTLCCTD